MSQFAMDAEGYVGLKIAPCLGNDRNDFHNEDISTGTAFEFIFSYNHGLVMHFINLGLAETLTNV